jgi:hypothetical protein
MMDETDRISAINHALAPISVGLAADGYEVMLDLRGDLLQVEIMAGPEACADCLVPDSVMRPMVEKLLEGVGGAGVRDVQIVYPS